MNDHRSQVPVYVRTGNWADDANCLGMNPDIFFPTRGEDVARARAICRACDVQVECAHYALNQDDTLQGIWGGLTQRDRRRIRRGKPRPAGGPGKPQGAA